MTSNESSRTQKILIGIMTAAALCLFVLEWAMISYNQVDTIRFSQFEPRGSVTEVTVGPEAIQGKLKDKVPSGKSAFVTASVDAELADKLEVKGVVGTGVLSGGLL